MRMRKLKKYKTEAQVVDVAVQRYSGNGRYVHFQLRLDIKRADNSSYETEFLVITPVKNLTYFKTGETIIVEVSVDDPNKVRVSNETYK